MAASVVGPLYAIKDEMKIDWITVRVIGQIIFGFVFAIVTLGLLTGIVLSFIIDDPPVITKILMSSTIIPNKPVDLLLLQP
jgi:hypothetical protein